MLQGSANFYSRGTYPSDLLREDKSHVDEKGREGEEGAQVEEWILGNSAVSWEGDEPLWRITFYTASPTQQPGSVSLGAAASSKTGLHVDGIGNASTIAGKGEPAYLAVSVAHELMDGTGLIKLVWALLADDIDVLPYESLWHGRLPAKTSGDIDSWTGWLGQCLPTSISRYFGNTLHVPVTIPSVQDSTVSGQDSSAWPTGHLSPTHNSLPHRITIHRLPADFVGTLKSLSAYHGVPTLTPVLLIAFLGAVRAVLKPSGGLTTVIPANDREITPGSAWGTGQYTSAHLFELPYVDAATAGAAMAGREGETGDGDGDGEGAEGGKEVMFWQEARRVALQLAHPESKAQARQNILALDTLANTRPSKAASGDSDTNSDPFVAFLTQQASSSRPYPQSVSFSNIGKIPLPPGASGVCVAGTCAVGDPPLEVVLSGTEEEGVVLTLAYKDGAVVAEEEARRVLRVWEGILRRLIIDGKEIGIDEVSKAATVGIGANIGGVKA